MASLPLVTALVCPLQRAELDHALMVAGLDVVATDSENTLMPALGQQPKTLAVVGQVCSQLRGVRCKTCRPCSWLRHTASTTTWASFLSRWRLSMAGRRERRPHRAALLGGFSRHSEARERWCCCGVSLTVRLSAEPIFLMKLSLPSSLRRRSGCLELDRGLRIELPASWNSPLGQDFLWPVTGTRARIGCLPSCAIAHAQPVSEPPPTTTSSLPLPPSLPPTLCRNHTCLYARRRTFFSCAHHSAQFSH